MDQLMDDLLIIVMNLSKFQMNFKNSELNKLSQLKQIVILFIYNLMCRTIIL